MQVNIEKGEVSYVIHEPNSSEDVSHVMTDHGLPKLHIHSDSTMAAYSALSVNVVVEKTGGYVKQVYQTTVIVHSKTLVVHAMPIQVHTANYAVDDKN